MRTIRFSWPPGVHPETTGEVFLDRDQARHGALVLRLPPGAAVEVIGSRGLAPARITSIEFSGSCSRKNPKLAVTLTGPWRLAEHKGPRLALALIQGQRFDWAVEKCVELGAAQLIPLVTERCKNAEANPGLSKQQRWWRLAEEARKQCGRAWPLDIMSPLGFDQLLSLPGPGFFLSPHQRAPDETAAPAASLSPLLVVGPEGGLSPLEEDKLLASGFKPWNLGDTILRSETAALAALAVTILR